MQLFKNVFDNYDEMRNKQNGKTSKATGTTYSSIKAIMIDIPELIRNKLESLNRSSEFKVVGSIGQGAVSEIPWVCIFNKKITVSAQKGYYIVLLFSSDMESCTLSLNQAVTEYKEKYTSKVAMLRMRHTANLAEKFIVFNSPAFNGKISLKAKNNLGMGYEVGAILSFQYSENNLPNQDEFLNDFLSLLKYYDDLFTICGNSLSSLNLISEEQYQQHSLELASTPQKLGKVPLSPASGGVPIPPKRKISGREVYARDDRFSAEALHNAGFKCEYDPQHKTFKSNISNCNYVEAHHLIPISKQGKFKFSIDITENIVSLCPTCHRLLHHGLPSDKKPVLQKLYEDRQKSLELRAITVSMDELLDFYSREENLPD
ncbi:MrcB family domain-containing protein [Chimaeribacter arupi]|uniref:MrcB family domain-containing protein n=1 Tax=Chimaeribacter arupi TaxID=2060066 RepID=UPI000C7D22D9|nr:DUF3578 domain-containing protein [Chimaeribacter arupi]PLR31220.1 hypothetical protein CYR23_16385 [Chimaeribacter arupi]